MKQFLLSLIVFLCLSGVLAACAPASASPIQQAATATFTTEPPTSTVEATAAPTQRPAATPTGEPTAAEVVPVMQPTATLPEPTPLPTLGPEDWKTLPIIPESISERMRQVYRYGLELGNNPTAFSKVGDCGSTPAWFLGDFDGPPEYYNLGKYTELQPLIETFKGSWDRTSVAAKSGMTTAAMFIPLWTGAQECTAQESPLECEYRLQRPSFVFVMLGTNDVWRPERFEPNLRMLIEYFLDNGVVPILSTKADNLEKDSSLNLTIARLAQEYELPLWNYWRAVQDTPNAGLQEDGAHLTYGRSFFDDPNELQTGWTQRNLTALQVLDAVWRGVTDS